MTTETSLIDAALHGWKFKRKSASTSCFGNSFAGTTGATSQSREKKTAY